MFKNKSNLVSISSLGGKKNPVKRMKKSRSSRPELFCKFPKILRKTPALESLFNRVTGLTCFHVNFAKFLRTLIL